MVSSIQSSVIGISLQPGPKDGLLHCLIKRNRSTHTYCLYLSLTNGKLIVVALLGFVCVLDMCHVLSCRGI